VTGAFELVALAVTFCFYLPLPIFLLTRGRIVAAGLISFASSVLPLIVWARATGDDSPGLGFALILVAPIPLLLLGVGAISLVVRAARRLFGHRVSELGL
jgi:hypothetical protein